MIGEMVISKEKFYSGLTLDAFAEGMRENKDKYEETLRGIELSDEQRWRIERANKPLRVMVIVEDWCGDVLRYVPVLRRMSEIVDSWDVRVFYRDANPELIGSYLKDGLHKAIPVIVFMDDNFVEIGYYQERPRQVYEDEAQARQVFAQEHAEQGDAHLAYDDMNPQTKLLYAPYMREYRAARAKTWQGWFIDEVLGIVA